VAACHYAEEIMAGRIKAFGAGAAQAAS
jgi:hypothetical protein